MPGSTAGASSEPAAPAGRWSFLGLMALAVVLSMTTWFSATAVIPELTARWDLSASAAAWLTNSVQLGFVVGALGSSLINLADVVRLNRLMAVSAVIGATANLFLLTEPGVAGAIAARFMTGLALAGVYPPALKMMATWFRRGRGLALGLLIGALTLGSSLPHLVRAVAGGVDWRLVVAVTSAGSLAAAAIFATAVREGPYPFARGTMDLSQLGAVLRSRPLLLANLGYFGHMWELYAMWGWFLAFAAAAGEAGNSALADRASLVTFAVVAAGVPGCILGGWMSDRIGRTLTTAMLMGVSGSCAVLMGFVFAGPAWAFLLVALIWGVTVIGDSAQFSAAVTELGDQRFVGTALALQLGLGFGLTVIAIWLVPVFAEWIGGWRWAFLMLVPGPLIGVGAMLALRRRPEAVGMAGGLR
jgi:MFS family permease